MSLTFIDLFAGVGGFRLGMEQAGHKCLGYVEWDKFARKSYEAIHNVKGEWTAHDITTVTNDDLRLLRGQVDVICGGFPCQSFSTAGKRLGFAETRGTLFFEIARFAKEIQPRYLFLENVRGILSHDEGNTFASILSTLDELGYDAEWDVLNSKDIGENPVPQNRERVFIIAHSRRHRTREVFPIGGTYKDTSIEVEGLIHGIDKMVYRVYSQDSISPCLDTMQGGLRQPKIRVNESNGCKLVGMLDVKGYNDFSRRVYDPSGVARTLMASGGSLNDKAGQYVVGEKPYRIRRLTPRECWRLQGFPDWAFQKAQEVNSDSQLYKQSGNSVTVPVIYEIARRLKK